jgi:hypothetical protein
VPTTEADHAPAEDSFVLDASDPTAAEASANAAFLPTKADPHTLSRLTGCDTVSDSVRFLRELVSVLSQDQALPPDIQRGLKSLLSDLRVAASARRGSDVAVCAEDVSAELAEAFTDAAGTHLLSNSASAAVQAVRAALEGQGKRCQIVYTSRTHSQLEQFVGEIKTVCRALNQVICSYHFSLKPLHLIPL